MRLPLPIFIFLLSIATNAQLPNYIPILVGDKYGFCDSNMNMLLEPEWDEVLYFQEKNYLIKKGEKQYYLNNQNGAITIGYDSILGVYSTNEKYNYSQYFKGGLRNDSLFIFYGIPDTVVLKIALKIKAGSYLQKIQVLDSAKNLFVVDFVFRERNRIKRFFEPLFYTKWKSYYKVISVKGVISTFEGRHTLFENGYFTEKINDRIALYKATPDSISKVTGYDYYYISPPNKYGVFTTVKADSVFKIKFFFYYNSFCFIDTLGNELLNVPYPNGNFFSFFRKPSLERNALFDTTERWFPTIYFKDSLTGKWPELEPYWQSYGDTLCYMGKIGENYIIGKIATKFPLTINRYGILNNSGRVILPIVYKSIYKVSDSLLLFDDSVSSGVMTSTGRILDKTELPAKLTYELRIWGNNKRFIVKYNPRNPSPKTNEQTIFRVEGNIIIPLDSNELKNLFPPVQTKGEHDTYWQLASKKIKVVTIDKYTDYWRIEVYCDSLLINPSLDIINVDNKYDVLFIMKSRMGHTWIIDNKGKIVYNTDGDYEYDVQYKTAGKINHFVITITNKNRKFIANIHWPGFVGYPYYSNLPIERFIDSFTVVKKDPKNKMVGLLDKNYKLIIPPIYREIIGKKSIGNGPYIFGADGYSEYKRFPFLRRRYYSETRIYDEKGGVIFDDVHSSFYPFQHFSRLYWITFNDNGILSTVFIDHYNTIYRK